MSIKNDAWIRNSSLSPVLKQLGVPPLLEPFEADQVRYEIKGSIKPGPIRPVISYGLSSYGYDIRCADEFKVFTNFNSSVVDPKNFKEDSFFDFKGDVCVIPPNSFALARSVERLCIPRNILAICIGKSTYARCGIIVNVTPLEPEWEGYITLELSNTTPLPARIYANEGIAQLIFMEADECCEVSYKDRQGKYQNQTGIVPPRV